MLRLGVVDLRLRKLTISWRLGLGVSALSVRMQTDASLASSDDLSVSEVFALLDENADLTSLTAAL